MAASTGMISALPQDIVRRFLARCDADELISAARVNPAWRELLDDGAELWLALCDMLWPGAAAALGITAASAPASVVGLYHRLRLKSRVPSEKERAIWRARCVGRWPELRESISHGLTDASLRSMYTSVGLGLCGDRVFVPGHRHTQFDELVLLWQSRDEDGEPIFSHVHQFNIADVVITSRGKRLQVRIPELANNHAHESWMQSYSRNTLLLFRKSTNESVVLMHDYAIAPDRGIGFEIMYNNEGRNPCWLGQVPGQVPEWSTWPRIFDEIRASGGLITPSVRQQGVIETILETIASEHTDDVEMIPPSVPGTFFFSFWNVAQTLDEHGNDHSSRATDVFRQFEPDDQVKRLAEQLQQRESDARSVEVMRCPAELEGYTAAAFDLLPWQ